MAHVLRGMGLFYRRNVRSLPGSPDFANKSRKWAVFVNGCFWHHHDGCARATVPTRNRDYWIEEVFGQSSARSRRRARAFDAHGVPCGRRLGMRGDGRTKHKASTRRVESDVRDLEALMSTWSALSADPETDPCRILPRHPELPLHRFGHLCSQNRVPMWQDCRFRSSWIIVTLSRGIDERKIAGKELKEKQAELLPGVGVAQIAADDSIANELRQAGDRDRTLTIADKGEAREAKRGYAQNLSTRLARRFADILRSDFPGVLPDEKGRGQESLAHELQKATSAST